MNKFYQIIATFFATVVQQGVQNRKFHSGNFPITFRRGRRIPISALISCSHVSSIPDYQYPSHLFNAAFFGFVIIFVALRCILESWSSSIFLMGCLLRFLSTVDPPSKPVTRTLWAQLTTTAQMQEESVCLVWGCITRFTRKRLRMFGLRVLLSLQRQIFLREETERMVGEERIGWRRERVVTRQSNALHRKKQP